MAQSHVFAQRRESPLRSVGPDVADHKLADHDVGLADGLFDDFDVAHFLFPVLAGPFPDAVIIIIRVYSGAVNTYLQLFCK